MLKRLLLNNIVFSVVSLIVGFFVEGLACVMYFTYNPPRRTLHLLFILFLHILGVLIFSIGMYIASKEYRFGNGRNWFIITLVMCLVFPGAGVIAACLLFAAIATNAWKKSDVFSDYEKYIEFDYDPEERHVDEQRLAETVSDELRVQPLVDIMLKDDVNLRRGAVNVMKRLPKKDAVSLLKQSLLDKSVEIRFYAALGLSEIESEITNNIDMAKKEIEKSPGIPDPHITLANSYSDYYKSGILDDVTAKHYLNLAADEYYLASELGGANAELYNCIGNIETIRGDHEKALSYYKVANKLDPENVYAHVGMVQVLYETGKVEEAAKLAKEVVGKMPHTKGPMFEIIKYWAA